MELGTKSDSNIGVFLVVISAVTFSSAGLFTKGVEAGAWEVIFWRGFFSAVFTTLWIVREGTFNENFFDIGKSGIVVAILGASGTAAFITSFKLTSIANVSLIYAASPLIAVLLAWLAIGERARPRTWLGCLGALVGVGLIVYGSLGQLNLNGDLLALWMSTVMASIMVIYRKFPETPAAGPAVYASVLLLPVALMLGQPLAVEPIEILILAIFGLLFAIASVTLAEGAKRIPSGQTALLSSLETPLALMFAFLLFSEVPNIQTTLGGLLVMIAVFASIKIER
ncbi:MAG: DMT family transporter [Chloroflexota bacterium]